tara:strand:- start:33662 stop:34501 length:840 start_codon:yes stop_codon:yes gene_type:complete
MKIKIICEVGINHNGDINIAKELIDIAKEAGADVVKFQKRTISKVYSKDILDQHRESPWGTTQREQKEGLEFSFSDYKEIDDYCKKNNIQWFASAWDVESLKFLDQFNLKYNKVASAMIVDEDFLKQVANRKLHTYISTGMSTVENINNAVEIFRNAKCSFELMHCVSTYPMKPEDANLKTIEALKQKYKCNVGYSGHETGVAVSVAAAALGITSLERHITLDRSMYGSDQSASLEPRGLRELVGSIRLVEKCIGVEQVGNIIDEEIPIAKKLRAHIKN